MKTLIPALMLLASLHAYSQTATLKSVLLTQLKSTHNQKDWFVPAKDAVMGLTAEQANWKDKSGNHSVAQLVQHLIFWNQRQLDKFQGKPQQAFSGDNNETFTNLDKAGWESSVKKLDAVLTGLEKLVETTDEKTLEEWYPIIANISTHNAYHIGQMVFVRKEQGVWNPDNGVK